MSNCILKFANQLRFSLGRFALANAGATDLADRSAEDSRRLRNEQRSDLILGTESLGHQARAATGWPISARLTDRTAHTAKEVIPTRETGPMASRGRVRELPGFAFQDDPPAVCQS